MSLLYMDLDPIDAIIQKLNDEFWKLAATKEEQHHQNALALLDDLASRHIYFQQFRLDMNCRLTHAKLFNSAHTNDHCNQPMANMQNVLSYYIPVWDSYTRAWTPQ